MTKTLISWLGRTDLNARTQSERVGLGPIAQAVGARGFARLELLCDYPREEAEPYMEWLKAQHPVEIAPHFVSLTNPVHFGDIYENATRVVSDAIKNNRGHADLTFHLSPGTPAMAAVWIILAKTRFPAELIESSREHGVRTASVPFDISADFIPDLLRKPDEELERLTAGLPPEAPEFSSIIHRSPGMKRVIARARRVAPRSIPVLIEGESGTGKELLARAIVRVVDVADGGVEFAQRKANITANDLAAYRKRVEETLTPLFETNPTLQKIRAGEPVTDADLNALNALIHLERPDVDLNILLEFYQDVLFGSFVTDEYDGATASTGFCVLRPRAGRLDGRFLYHGVQTAPFVGEMVKLATGASYPAVSDRIVKGSKIPLPPLPKQKRIAAILDKADAIRRKRRQALALALADQFLRAVFLDMFGDPVTNPKGWKEKRLDQVAVVASGITKGKRFNGKKTVHVPYMRVANVQDGHINLGDVQDIEVLETDVERYLLKPGDILLTEGGDPDKLGRGAVWHGEVAPCIHQNHIFKVRVDPDTSVPEFMSTLIGSQRGKRYFLKSAKQTTGIASINKTQLSGFPALLPPWDVQREFLSRVKRWRSEQEKLGTLERESANLFGSLAQRAFRGEL